jgi:hypothetical protein
LLLKEGDFELPLGDAHSPTGISKLWLHIRSDEKTCDDFLFNNILLAVYRQSQKHPLDRNLLLLVYGLKHKSSCITRLNEKYGNQMDFVTRDDQYPQPLYVHPDLYKTPVLVSNRPIAVSDSSLKGIYAFGMPEYRGQEACFNYLEELLEAAGKAQEKLEEDSKVELHLLLPACYVQMQRIFMEWCSAKTHGMPPCVSVSNEAINPSRNTILAVSDTTVGSVRNFYPSHSETLSVDDSKESPTIKNSEIINSSLLLKVGDFEMTLADAHSPPGISKLYLHIRAYPSICHKFIINNIQQETDRQNIKHPLDNNLLLLVYDEKFKYNDRLKKRLERRFQIDSIARKYKYPEPLYVHSEVSTAQVLVSNRAIAVRDSSIKAIYAYGMPDMKGKEVCFYYLEEILEAAGKAQGKLDEDSGLEVHLVLPAFYGKDKQNIFMEWCTVKGHRMSPCRPVSRCAAKEHRNPTIRASGLPGFCDPKSTSTSRDKRSTQTKQKKPSKERKSEPRLDNHGRRDITGSCTDERWTSGRDALRERSPKIDLHRNVDSGFGLDSSPVDKRIPDRTCGVIDGNSGMPPSLPLTSQLSRDSKLDDLTLGQHFVHRLRKRGRATDAGVDMMRTWRLVGHNEKTLRNLCREKQPPDQNTLKLLLVKELDGVPKLPDSHSCTELIDDTAEYFLPIEEDPVQLPEETRSNATRAPTSEYGQQSAAAAVLYNVRKPSYEQCLDSWKSFRDFLITNKLRGEKRSNVLYTRLLFQVEEVTTALAKSRVHIDSLLQVYIDLGSESVVDLVKGKLAMHSFALGISATDVALVAKDFLKTLAEERLSGGMRFHKELPSTQYPLQSLGPPMHSMTGLSPMADPTPMDWQPCIYGPPNLAGQPPFFSR